MTISRLNCVSDVAEKLATYPSNQIARLAGVVSFVFHIGLWQSLQTAATHESPTDVSHPLEVTLMDDTPKPTSQTSVSQPQLPAIAEGRPVAIPLPISDPLPLKALDKPLRKQPKLQEKNGPPVKRIKVPNSSQSADRSNDPPINGSAGGYGVTSQTGQGVSGSIGLGGGVGGGTGGGYVHGQETGSGTGSDKEAYSEANFRANYATNPKPKYPETARNRGWVGTVLAIFAHPLEKVKISNI